MVKDTNRSRRSDAKRGIMVALMLICSPLVAGCDVAQVMAAIGQLVTAIGGNTAATGAAAPGTTAGTTAAAVPVTAGGLQGTTPAAIVAPRAYQAINAIGFGN